MREVAQDITADYPNLSELIDNMFETMEESDGVGWLLLKSVFLSAYSLLA